MTATLEPDDRQALQGQVRARISELSQEALTLLVQRVLISLGYGNVRLQRYSGGVDLVAEDRTELGPEKVLVTIKRYTLHRRFVDELRGAMLRRHAPRGIAVTTEDIPQAAVLASACYPGRPVRLVGGKELASLCIGARLGVKEDAEGNLALDEGWFTRLEEHARKPKRKRPTACGPGGGEPLPEGPWKAAAEAGPMPLAGTLLLLFLLLLGLLFIR